jgi:hypothetical protein
MVHHLPLLSHTVYPASAIDDTILDGYFCTKIYYLERLQITTFMKKILFSSYLAIATVFATTAQITDTVSTGQGYANQVWYNLDNGNVTSVAGDSWDLGFQINGFSAAILVNAAYGAELYKYPNGDTSDWSTLDTTGMSSWTAWYDPSNTWQTGAFNLGKNPNNASDLGWGNYNFITHHVTADSVYVWRAANGVVKKVWIDKLASGTYDFIISNIDGTNQITKALAKSSFAGKNFGYYSITNDTILDLEPLSNSWDLVFSKYIVDLGIPYSVSGIRTNAGLETVQVYPVNNVPTYDSAAMHTYSNDIDVIGWDWKGYSFSCSCYNISDSTVYFVKEDSVSYWKLVMKDFGGSSNGNYIFEKTKINLSTGIFEAELENQGKLMVYPNPTTDRNISLVADLPQGVQTARLNITNSKGQLVKSEEVRIGSSFDVLTVQLDDFKTGIYFVQLHHKEGVAQTKLILR